MNRLKLIFTWLYFFYERDFVLCNKTTFFLLQRYVIKPSVKEKQEKPCRLKVLKLPPIKRSRRMFMYNII